MATVAHETEKRVVTFTTVAVAQTADVEKNTRGMDDAGNTFNFNGTSWDQTGTGGVGHVAVKTKDNEPASWFTPFDKTAADVNDTTVIHNSGDVSMHNLMEFTVETAPGAGSIGAYVSQNGVDFFGPVHVVNRSVSVGSGSQSIIAIVAVGAYYIMGRFKELEIRNVGVTTGAAARIVGSHSTGNAR